ncbi:glyoxalase [Veronia pacifica]|uniref:Glyoxalase n=2 Tax=Veronia pacifica TaxID=1080227 RepID=A0A1C3ES65_9GAMM|nr:glyoxalase [Veronia pacifica]
MSKLFKVLSYEHVGIRVSDRSEALRFYAGLGMNIETELPEHDAAELINDYSVTLNLIFNAEPNPSRTFNVLQDSQVKLPGITHVAFVVDSMNHFVMFCHESSITITEGPMKIGPNRIACFIRDPDGNVLEFNEYIEPIVSI